MEVVNKLNKLSKESKSIVLIIASVFVFRSSFYEPFRIPSGSMIPTLLIGDFILVEKFSYGFKLPFSDFTMSDKINLSPIYLFGKSDPKRGDVVVFKFPSDPNTNFIKRVVGLPGDAIEVKNKIIFINDKPVNIKEIDGKEIANDMDDKFKGYNFKFYKEQLGNSEHIIQHDQDNYYKLNYPKTIIPAGKFFMMGDNRDNSFDSRGWGFVSRELIKGRALFVWFSFILPIGEDRAKFRPWRIGKSIN